MFNFDLQQLDTYFRPEPLFMYPDFLRGTNVVAVSDVRIGHAFTFKQDTNNFVSSLSSLPKHFFLLSALLVPLIWISVNLALIVGRHIDSMQQVLFTCIDTVCIMVCSSPDGRRSLSTRLPWLCCALGFGTFCVTNLYCSLMQLDKMTLNLNELLQNLGDVLKTKRRSCWLLFEGFLGIISTSPPGSILDLVWQKHGGSKCLFSKKMGEFVILSQAPQEYFVMVDEYYLESFFYWTCQRNDQYNFWLSTKSIYAQNTVLYFGKHYFLNYLIPNRQAMLINNLLEMGVYSHVLPRTVRSMFSASSNKRCVYKTTSEVEEAFKSTEMQVNLFNLIDVFFFMILIYLLFFTCFAIKRFGKKIQIRK
jgi:hypothetical protein